VSSVGHGRERRREFTGGANGGRRRTAVLLGRAQGKAGEVFVGHSGDDMGAEAVCAPTSVGKPRGTGLGR
jgi:hypothetical protein